MGGLHEGGAGYHVWAFGIVLIPYLFSCMALDMKEAIAPIAVLGLAEQGRFGNSKMVK